MTTMILNNRDISPTSSVLEKALGRAFPAYQELMSVITTTDIDLSPEWHYYNDGKAWLCKVQYKKKTIFWLSVFNKYFKVGFYFSERTCAGIGELNIDDNIKRKFAETRAIGKLHPLSIMVNNKTKLHDVLVVLKYKKGLK